jgi:DNA-binding beta-propeller fold protein YncE
LLSGDYMQSRSLPGWLKAIVMLALIVGVAACSRPHDAAGPQQALLVTLPDTRMIAAFAANVSGDAQPLSTISESAPDLPVEASADLRGEIFVANANANLKIYVGEHGKFQLVRSLAGPHTELANVTSMAVDPSGNMFVADRGRAPGEARILWYAAALNGNILPGRVITGPHTGLTSPTGVAIDASDETFVADHDSGKVLVFAADANGDAAPVFSIGRLKGPNRLFVDSDLNLYVTCQGDNSVTVFVPDGPQVWSPNYTLTSPAMHAPAGIAVDNAGRIAVAVRGAVLFFAADARGVATPVQDLQGPWPMNPTGLMIR